MTDEDVNDWLRLFRNAVLMGQENASVGGQVATMVCVLMRDALRQEADLRKAKIHPLQNIKP